MKTGLYHQINHNRLFDKTRYTLKAEMYAMNKWKGIGYSSDTRPVYIEKSNLHYIRFRNHKEIVYCLIATGVETNNPSYGICVLKGGHLVDCALDLSKSYDEVKSLVVLCNQEDLQPIHFRNILEDFFCIKQQEPESLISKGHMEYLPSAI